MDVGRKRRQRSWRVAAGSLNIENFAEDPRFVLPSFAVRERVTGYLGVPLKLGKDVLGVLEVFTREPRRFTPDEMRLMLTFASQASVGLQNALLVEQAGRRLDDLQALGALSEKLVAACAVNSFSDSAFSPELFTDALRLLGEATRADAGILRLFKPPHGTYVYHRAEGLDTEESEAMDSLLRDLAVQIESTQNRSLPLPDHAMPILMSYLSAGPEEAAQGVLFLFVRRSELVLMGMSGILP